MTPKPYPAFLDFFRPSFWREVRKEWRKNNATPEGKEKLRKQHEDMARVHRLFFRELPKMQVEAEKSHLLVIKEILDQFNEGKMHLSLDEMDGIQMAIEKHVKPSPFPDRNDLQYADGKYFVKTENLAK